VHAETLLGIIEYEASNAPTKTKSSGKIRTVYNFRRVSWGSTEAGDNIIEIRPPPGLTDPGGGLVEYGPPAIDRISNRHLSVQEFMRVGPEESHSLEQLSIFLRNLLGMVTIGEA